MREIKFLSSLSAKESHEVEDAALVIGKMGLLLPMLLLLLLLLLLLPPPSPPRLLLQNRIIAERSLTSGLASLLHSGTMKKRIPSNAPSKDTPRTTNTVSITYGKVAVKYAT